MTSPNRLARLPRWISHWLGYRAAPIPKKSEYVVGIWSFIGAFWGISSIQILLHSEYFIHRRVPGIIASCGASAVLCYGALESPLAQPRSLMGGHFIGALIGVCVTKLFDLSPAQNLRWLAGSLSASIAIVTMQITGTTHPPAGATALLAAVSPEVYQMGWYYLPIVLLSTTLLLVSALLINNIQRRYPVFWWAPDMPAVSKPLPDDPEKGIITPPIEAVDIAHMGWGLPGAALENCKALVTNWCRSAPGPMVTPGKLKPLADKGIKYQGGG
ncbi:HPP family-domain-containing protein [Mycena rosella]|uniref:HPP family-domain-containing protein n=1 Tax=Mycena rosella TaxID=1033263 RepID=A0AAD7CZ65_MYCRO|nr:HPP family-domain-containing protein [Mycena rosella]